MSSHMSRQILFLFRTGQRHVPLCSRFLVNPVSPTRSSAAATISPSAKKTQRNCLRIIQPPLGTGYGRPSGTYCTCILDKSSTCSLVCCGHAATNYTHVAGISQCGVEEWTRPCLKTLKTGFCLSPCATSPHEIPQRALQQSVRRASTKKEQRDPKAVERKPQKITKPATEKNAGANPASKKKAAGDEPQGIIQKTTTRGSVCREEKSSSRSADTKKASRSASVPKEVAAPGKKERSRKSAVGEGEKEGNPIPNIPASPESLFLFRYSRSSKPGGSSANKSETKVALHVPLKALEAFYGVPMDKLTNDPRGKVNKKGELIITSEKHGSQALNKKECMQRLDDMLTSLHELYISEEQKTPYVIDEETQKKYKFDILVRKKKEQYHRKCNKVNVRDLRDTVST